MADQKPTLLKKIVNFTIAYIKYAFSGFKDVDSDTYITRLSTCLRCKYATHLNECGICGCPIFEKAKMKTEKCPKNKWK